MARAWARYMHYLDVYPLPTKAITSATLYTAGDGIAQYVDGTLQTRGYNADRGLKAAVWGGIIFAPLAHVWYNRVLERYVPGASNRAVATKVFLDQTGWGLAVNSLYLYYASDTHCRHSAQHAGRVQCHRLLTRALLSPLCVCSTIAINGGSPQDANRAVQTKIWPLMKANWMLWPAVQVINFKFVPPPLQVPFINVVVLGWSAFLALLATSKTEDSKEAVKAKIEEIKER
jgi:protein Mpv17